MGEDHPRTSKGTDPRHNRADAKKAGSKSTFKKGKEPGDRTQEPKRAGSKSTLYRADAKRAGSKSTLGTGPKNLRGQALRVPYGTGPKNLIKHSKTGQNRRNARKIFARFSA